MLHLDKITHSYRPRTTALDALSVTITPGTITAIIGPNGSGKTTLANILCGRLTPTMGRVLFDGEAVDRPTLVASTALAYTDNAFTSARVLDMLRFARLRPTWDESVFSRVATRFDIAAQRSMSRLSQGQKTLVSLALALGSGAPITFLDEVTANLDVPTRLAVQEEIIATSADSGRTFLIASHLVAELEGIAEDVIVLDKGRLVAARSVDEIRRSVVGIVGEEAAVRQLVTDEGGATTRILDTRSLGRYAQVQVLDAPAPLIQAARTSGFDIIPASLQDAFVALVKEEIR